MVKMPEILVPSNDMLIDKTSSGLGKMYRLRKKQSKYQCEQIINNTQTKDIIEIYTNEKKKDDLSDCFLQALSWIMFDKNKKKQGPVIQRKPTKKTIKIWKIF